MTLAMHWGAASTVQLWCHPCVCTPFIMTISLCSPDVMTVATWIGLYGSQQLTIFITASTDMTI